GDGVPIVEMHAHADARCLFAGIEMDEPGDVAGREFVVHGILELADEAHPRIGFNQIFPAQLHRLPPWLLGGNTASAMSVNDSFPVGRTSLACRCTRPSRS